MRLKLVRAKEETFIDIYICETQIHDRKEQEGKDVCSMLSVFSTSFTRPVLKLRNINNSQPITSNQF